MISNLNFVEKILFMYAQNKRQKMLTENHCQLNLIGILAAKQDWGGLYLLKHFFNFDFSTKNIYGLEGEENNSIKREQGGGFYISVSWFYGAKATVVITLNHRPHHSFGLLMFILIRTSESRNERKKEVRAFRQCNYRRPPTYDSLT